YELHDAALRLRHDLLGEHEHVAVLELSRFGDELGDVVAVAHLRQSCHRNDAQLVHPSRSRSRWTSSRTKQSAMWSFTMPQASSVEYTVVGPTNRKPRRFSSLDSAVASVRSGRQPFQLFGAARSGVRCDHTSCARSL